MKRLILPLVVTIIVTCLSPIAAAVTAEDFSDISPGAWYYESVDYAVRQNLFNGTGNGKFSPDAPMSRAMFVTVLGRCAAIAEDISYGIITKSAVNVRSAPSTSADIVALVTFNTVVRILGLENGWYKILYNEHVGYIRADLMGVYSGPFSDVASGQYYSPYVLWAYYNKIVSGTSSKTFSPASDVSREQICVILYNFAASQDVELPRISPQSNFTDDSKISSWAKTAVYALQQAGIVSGRNGGGFDPSSGATRAEVAVIFHRFIKNTGYIPPNDPGSSTYSYGDDVPESAAVGAGYFSNACFIGHSLVSGMSSRLGFSDTDYYGVSGISAGGMLGYGSLEYYAVVKDEYGGDTKVQLVGTLADALDANSYGKVYLMFGVNELGPEVGHEQAFYNNMRSMLDLVRKYQPNATIYVMSLTPIGFERSEESEYYNKQNAMLFNETLRRVCAEKRAHYLDVFTPLADEDGYLLESLSATDGIHLLSPAYAIIKTYLLTHTM